MEGGGGGEEGKGVIKVRTDLRIDPTLIRKMHCKLIDSKQDVVVLYTWASLY